jgi:hypothetical protein
MFTSNVQDEDNQEEEHDEIEKAWEQQGHNESYSDGNYEEPMAPPTLSRQISRKPSGIPYTPSGLTTAINRTYPTGDIPPEDITSTLRWQADVNGEAAAIQGFRTEILAQQGLVVFAFIQTEDHHLSLLHSPALYAARGATGALKGKDIGFVGDRTDFATQFPPYSKRYDHGNGTRLTSLMTSWDWKPFSQTNRTWVNGILHPQESQHRDIKFPAYYSSHQI